MYLAFRDLAATMLPEYPAILQELRTDGVVVNNIEDVNDLIRLVKQGKMQDIPINVKSYKSYKFHDLENMYPNNLDPTFIDATIHYEISKGLKMAKAMPMVLGGVVMLIMVSAVAIFILNKAFKGSMDPGECQMMVSAA